MCGIAGVLSLGAPLRDEDAAAAEAMTGVLRHRGPDSRGLFRDERCALGNTRLKIIDLSEQGALPMTNEDGTVRLCYNGEVTNFRELKARFRLAEKHRFRSESDSEVLLHLYEELGIAFLAELSGVFALCLYDQRAGKAFLVRDFYGVRPLFYMEKPERLYFSSEIKSMLEVPSFQGTVDREAIFHFLQLAYIPDVHTPFAEVRELQGGRLIEVDLAAGKHSERAYYDLRYAPDYSITEAEAAKTVRELLRDSVRRNLISDAPLGLTLSGGVDTSTILALAAEAGAGRELHTFSIRMTEPSFDETRYQRLMVERFRPVHHEVIAGPAQVRGSLLPHMAFMDEPMGDGSAIPLYLLAKAAKPHVSVLLSGEGGDEVFNAYETHRAYKVRAFYRRFPAALRALARGAAQALPAGFTKLPLDFLARRFTEGAELGVPESHFHWRHVLPDAECRKLVPGSADFPRTDAFFTKLYGSVDWEEELNRLSLVDWKYFFIGDVMVKNDRVLMAHSVEARFPYADRLLMDYVTRIPPELRVKGLFTGRYIQRQAMKDLLPREICRRQNMGLETPHSVWFFREFRELAESYFTRERVERTGLLEFGPVRELWEDHLARRRDNGRALWCILSVLIWFELFVHTRDYKKHLK
ncbi:MAG: asparagine synthase (glutamine-hydrolyzing) [Elusimicrobia bacterium GWA2_69_24]|nr:MAG: asparagine synthase (glutamine-hydrolyzing) [Elusimicrobia bacterium GWA2_69_24]